MGRDDSHDAGDQCPENLGQDDSGEVIDCPHELSEREHDFDPQLDDLSGVEEELEPEGPVSELICPIHGIVQSE